MAKDGNLQEKKKGGRPIGKQALFSMASAHATKAIKRLVELMDSDNENVAVSASKAILAKCLPDLKATEFKGDKLPIMVVIGEEYARLPKDTNTRRDGYVAPSTGSSKTE